MERAKAKQSLNVSINPYLYERLKKEFGDRKVSGFVEKAIAKELSEYDKERKEFQKKLIASHQRTAKNQKLKKELAVWDETVDDYIDKDNGKN